MRTVSSLVAIAGLLLSARSLANPIAMEVVRARLVPGTTHVQVTHAIDASLDKENDPLSVRRDDTALSPTWTAASPFSANTGSGLHETRARQFCDCDVPLGQHRYAVRVKSLDFSGTEMDLTADVTVVQPGTEAKDAGVSRDLSPWEIPEPGPQGIACGSACVSSPGGDAGARPPATDTGCSLSSRGAGPALLLGVALAGALWLGARTRRRRTRSM